MFYKVEHTKKQQEIIEACNRYLDSEEFELLIPEKIIYRIDLVYTEIDFDESFSSFHGLFDAEYDIPMSIHLDMNELKLYAEYYEEGPDIDYVKCLLEEYANEDEAIESIDTFTFQSLYSIGIDAYDSHMEKKYQTEKAKFLEIMGEHFDEMLPLIKTINNWM